jgi:hypothetical protein
MSHPFLEGVHFLSLPEHLQIWLISTAVCDIVIAGVMVILVCLQINFTGKETTNYNLLVEWIPSTHKECG